MAKDNKYSFFESYHNALARVSDERYGRVVRAMSSFVFKQEEPNFSDDADWIVWELIRPILERGIEISKSRADAGANGGRKGKGVSRNKGNRNAAKDGSASIVNQKQNNSKQKQNNSGIGIGVGKDKDIDSSLHSESPLSNDNVSAHAQDSEDMRLFKEWLKNNCPYIFRHYTLPTEKELEKLEQKYDQNVIVETCQQIENRIDLRKKYSNLYRTLLNWIERDYGSKDKNTNGATQRAEEAASIVARLMAEDDAKTQRAEEAKKIAEERRSKDVTQMMTRLMEEDTYYEQG